MCSALARKIKEQDNLANLRAPNGLLDLGDLVKRKLFCRG